MCRHPRPSLAPVTTVTAADFSQDFDPAAELRALAGRLAQAHELEPSNAAVARELRQALQALGGGTGAAGDAEVRDLFDSF